MDLSTEVIIDASKVIDNELLKMTKNNRGECAKVILKFVRDINDHLANKIWSEEHPDEPMGLQKVAKQFERSSQYRFIGKLDKFIRKFLAHCTPDEDGAERLLIKYYPFLIKHKEVVKRRYNLDILHNIDLFLDDIDDQTKDYYGKVAERIDYHNKITENTSNKDNYYIHRKKPFVVNRRIYYEITLEPADEKPNKFNRITAFTSCEIMDNYSVSLSFVEDKINVFNTNFPIKIIKSWEISIRPCEIRNFSKILNYNIKPYERSNVEYIELMKILKNEELSLVDVIDLDEKSYLEIKDSVSSRTKEGKSKFFDVLDNVREISNNNEPGKNILRYLLYRLNNRIIKFQWPFDPNKTYGNFYLARGCQAFDEKPVSFNPKGHLANIHDVIDSIDIVDKQDEFLARKINVNAERNNKLFTKFDEVVEFGNKEQIIALVNKYNESLYSGFRPNAEIGIFRDYLYNKGYEKETFKIIQTIDFLSKQNSNYGERFTEDKIEKLKQLEKGIKLDDEGKEKILTNMFNSTRVYCLYGAAGTGKSTLINYVASLMKGTHKAFIAKTNPAVENLKHRIIDKDTEDVFVTIDKFIKSSIYTNDSFDLIVVDECSTVKNEEISKILGMLGSGIILLSGDIYQIESIGFGNWFKLEKKFLSEKSSCELVNLYRSEVPDLKELWQEVRTINDDNVALEEMVRDKYSHIIDDDIFIPKAKDEIILCLNYNGLYGLNNINSLLQLSDNGDIPFVNINIWKYRVGDKILFNDSDRFTCLYNNLKGIIIDIEDHKAFVRFKIEVDIKLTEEEVSNENGLDLIEANENSSIVQFNVFRHEPYYTDNESESLDHIIPFQVAYAVSIHKSQGLEYDSVKIVIADDSEEMITHNIFYTAITRAKNFLTLYWTPEVGDRILNRIRPDNNNDDYYLLKLKNNIIL